MSFFIDINSWRNLRYTFGAIYSDGCDMSLRDEKKNLYHIATKRSEVISNLRSKYIERAWASISSINFLHLFGSAFQKNEIFHWMFTFSLNYDKIGAEVYNIATEQSGLYLIKAFLKLIYLNFFGLPAEANDSSYYFKQK